MSRHPRINPTKGGSPGRYCTFCGSKLVERVVQDGFDSRNGRPLIEQRRDCPNGLAA